MFVVIEALPVPVWERILDRETDVVMVAGRTT
jgi:hypothetical protein